MARTIQVVIKADTRQLRRSLIRAQMVTTRSRVGRFRLRWALWRVGREGPP